jgi:hypothetical protein
VAPSWFFSVSRHPLRGMPAMWPCLASRVAAATGLACPPRSVTRLSAKPLRFAHRVGLGARADFLALPVVRLDPQPARARVAATAVKHRLDERFRMGSRMCDKATPGAGVRHAQTESSTRCTTRRRSRVGPVLGDNVLTESRERCAVLLGHCDGPAARPMPSTTARGCDGRSRLRPRCARRSHARWTACEWSPMPSASTPSRPSAPSAGR